MTESYKSFVEFHFGPNSLPARRDVQLHLLLNTFLFTATGRLRWQHFLWKLQSTNWSTVRPHAMKIRITKFST